MERTAHVSEETERNGESNSVDGRSMLVRPREDLRGLTDRGETVHRTTGGIEIGGTGGPGGSYELAHTY